MKKAFCICTLMVLLLMVLGCDDITQIRVTQNSGRIVSVDLPGHELNKECPYDIIYTDNGCDVIVHFTKTEELK